MDSFAFSADQVSNLWNKIRDCLIQKLSINTTVSIQTLMAEIKAVVFENDELENQDMSKLKALRFSG